MSGVEGSEREDYDEREAGVGFRLPVKSKGIQAQRTRRFTKEDARITAAPFVNLRVLCGYLRRKIKRL